MGIWGLCGTSFQLVRRSSLERHASGNRVKPKPLELVKLSGACVHVGTNVSNNIEGWRRGMGCNGKGSARRGKERERLGEQHCTENYGSGSGDLICPVSACEL